MQLQYYRTASTFSLLLALFVLPSIAAAQDEGGGFEITIGEATPMKIGSSAQIVYGVDDIRAAVTFFRTLGFVSIDSSSEPWPWHRFTDGKNVVMVESSGNVYAGLVFFGGDVADRAGELVAAGATEVMRSDGSAGVPSFVILSTPSQHLINLLPGELDAPPPVENFPLGTFGEIACYAADYPTESAFWKECGMAASYESEFPHAWGIFMGGNVVLGLHNYPGEIEEAGKGPTLTYFSPDSEQRIREIQAKGMKVTNVFPTGEGEPIVHGMIEGPDLIRVFLFQEEM